MNVQTKYIDDKQAYLDPAKRMGFTTILAQNPKQIMQDVHRTSIFEQR